MLLKKFLFPKIINSCRRSLSSEKSAFVFFEDLAVDVKEGDRTFVAFEVENSKNIPKDAVLFSKSKVGSFSSILKSFNDELQVLKNEISIQNSTIYIQNNTISELNNTISELKSQISSQKSTIDNLCESQSILLTQYLILNLPQFLENCVARIINEHAPEIEIALGRKNRMELLFKMSKQDHPKSTMFMGKPEVVALLKARQLLLTYEGVKKRNLLGHDKNVWFHTLSLALVKLESFAKFHNTLTKENLKRFVAILDAMKPWENISFKSSFSNWRQY